MKTLTAILLLTLSACGVTTTPEKLAKALKVCEQNGGAKEVYVRASSDEFYTVYCNNGARFDVSVK